MKIHNIRMGLATNSSSTHSLIFMDSKEYASNNPTDEYHEFGWDNFTAADEISKENYLGTILLNNLTFLVGIDIARLVVDGLFPNRSNFSDQLENGYVDHQSAFGFPTDWEGKGLNVEFFKELRDYVINNPIAILGGNDNGDNDHPLKDSTTTYVDLGLPEYGSLVARKDGDYWVLFNRDTGAKVRLSFSSKTGVVSSVSSKAKTPELVDVKITDYCPFGCKFCYQNSTKEGKHAETSLLRSLAYTLSQMKVFEVAIGGGEPTLHPDFIDIITNFRSYNVIPNFTTRSLAWLNEPKKAAAILKTCGAFAYSVSTREDVAKLHAALEKLKFDEYTNRVKLSVQYVLNSGGDLYGVLDEASKHYYRVTLLGFKTTGLGSTFTLVPEDWMTTVKEVKKTSWLNLGVDTAIVQKYGKQLLEELGISDVLMTSEEGKFSMYIDAVEKTMAPSSYCEADKYVPFTTDKWGRLVLDKSIEQAFKSW
jgi:hypothetical protein